METFSTLLALYAGNSPVTVEFPAQRPVTWSFDVFFDLRLNEQLSKQSLGWWFETPLCSLWRHCNEEYWSSSHCIGYATSFMYLVFSDFPANWWYIHSIEYTMPETCWLGYNQGSICRCMADIMWLPYVDLSGGIDKVGCNDWASYSAVPL